MADPNPYVVSYNFGGFQANNPSAPLPADAVDDELAGIAAATVALVAAVKDIRRSDGALKNGIVTFDSFELGLQLTVDPTNGLLVAAAVATAQAAAASAAAFDTSAGVHEAAAEAAAAAAEASAATVNLSLYLPKAGNLADLGNIDTALANLQASKNDGTTNIGRLAPRAAYGVTDWNDVATSGWFAGNAAANAPLSSTDFWLVQCITYDDGLWVTQIAYPFVLASGGTAAVTPYRRHSHDVASVRTWTQWEGASPVPVGSTIWVNSTSAPAGFIKENGALLSRATYPALYTYAAASGNIVTEASWSSGNSGAFSTGDLSTTFRIPDSRGEFVRGYDDSRGVDTGRVLGARQADELKAHIHGNAGSFFITSSGGGVYNAGASGGQQTTTSSTGGAETRPRNIAKLACVKY